MKSYKTSQENFWAGNYGDTYMEQNDLFQSRAQRVAVFSEIIRRTAGIESTLELGASIGHNLEALRILLPDVKYYRDNYFPLADCTWFLLIKK